VFFSYLLANLSRFGISSSILSPLMLLRDDFMTKYAAATAPSTRTKAVVLAKNNALKALKEALRAFILEHLTYNHLVTDVDRDNLGLPIRKTSHTLVPIPTTYPEFQVDSSTIRILVIHFRNAGSRGRAKPFGVHGSEIK
jgi:hypothetical protein